MKLKEMLVREGVVKVRSDDEEAFTLKSGKKSRLFFDEKGASLNPTILEAIIEEVDVSFVQRFDKIASVAVGGVPIATALSLVTRTPQIIVRAEKHDRGTKTKVVGRCNNANVILIEDVATSGGSLVNAVKDIREAGGICDHCIVVIHRQEGADKLCNENGIALMPILKKSDFGIYNEV